MARIIGRDVPNNKRTVIGLTYIYGIGRKIAQEIVMKLGLDPNKKVKDLTFDEIAKINTLLQKEYVLEGDLKREIQQNIERLIRIGSYRGMRHRLKLPVRGQRTRSNARCRKGKKKTVAGKKI